MQYIISTFYCIFMFHWVIYHYLFWTGSNFLPAFKSDFFPDCLTIPALDIFQKTKNMYFITEQFYQLPIKGFLTDILTSIFGRATPNENNEKTRQKPRLLDLHLAEINQRQSMWFQRIIVNPQPNIRTNIILQDLPRDIWMRRRSGGSELEDTSPGRDLAGGEEETKAAWVSLSCCDSTLLLRITCFYYYLINSLIFKEIQHNQKEPKYIN